MPTFSERLAELCRERRSRVCIGLDPVPDRLPASVRSSPDPVLAFNKAIVDATIDFAPVYKPNLGFYEALGLDGWRTLKSTIDHIGGRAIVLGDAKRGDIDSTMQAYARAMFDVLGLDACTISVYLGRDAAAPFLARADKGVFILCRTSNPHAGDLQDVRDGAETLYARVARLAVEWNEHGNAALVVGATYPREMARIREIAPDLPILVPGVGAQGGDLEASAQAAAPGPFVISSSRAVLYASAGEDFAEAARRVALDMRDRIEAALSTTSSSTR